MKILVVDDSSTMRRILINTIHTLGSHDIVEAENGADALAKLQESNGADLILTDWNMPVMNGLEFLKQVMAGPYKGVPVIFVTTESEKCKVVEALRNGARNYVVKPFTPEILKEKIKQALQTHGA